MRKLAEASPHSNYAVSVFVSPEGRKAMFNATAFPKGSRIVKRKALASTDEVEMSTFMIKRGKGFNPACGDWEFGTLDASGKKITSRGKLDACMSCHIDQRNKDFTFRTYVPSKPSR